MCAPALSISSQPRQRLSGWKLPLFNQECSLFYCTPTYLKKKGNAVHYAFIQDVIVNGSVLVTEPGKMPACIGCRFNEHCPSTMEILCCIHSGTEVAGVVSFTAFTKEGQKREFSAKIRRFT